MNELSNRQRKPDEQIILYICPTRGCSNYYAAPGFRPDRDPTLAEPQHRRDEEGGKVAGPSRLACPACRLTRNLNVNRVPYIVTSILPLSDAIQALR